MNNNEENDIDDISIRNFLKKYLDDIAEPFAEKKAKQDIHQDIEQEFGELLFEITQDEERIKTLIELSYFLLDQTMQEKIKQDEERNIFEEQLHVMEQKIELEKQNTLQFQKSHEASQQSIVNQMEFIERLENELQERDILINNFQMERKNDNQSENQQKAELNDQILLLENHYKGQIKELKEQIIRYKEEIKVSKQQVAEQNLKLQEQLNLQEEILNLNQSKNNKIFDYEDLRTEKVRLEGQIKQFEVELDNQSEMIEQYQNKILMLNDDIINLKNHVGDLENEIQIRNEQNQEIDQAIQEENESERGSIHRTPETLLTNGIQSRGGSNFFQVSEDRVVSQFEPVQIDGSSQRTSLKQTKQKGKFNLSMKEDYFNQNDPLQPAGRLSQLNKFGQRNSQVPSTPIGRYQQQRRNKMMMNINFQNGNLSLVTQDPFRKSQAPRITTPKGADNFQSRHLSQENQSSITNQFSDTQYTYNNQLSCKGLGRISYTGVTHNRLKEIVIQNQQNGIFKNNTVDQNEHIQLLESQEDEYDNIQIDQEESNNLQVDQIKEPENQIEKQSQLRYGNQDQINDKISSSPNQKQVFQILEKHLDDSENFSTDLKQGSNQLKKQILNDQIDFQLQQTSQTNQEQEALNENKNDQQQSQALEYNNQSTFSHKNQQVAQIDQTKNQQVAQIDQINTNKQYLNKKIELDQQEPSNQRKKHVDFDLSDQNQLSTKGVTDDYVQSQNSHTEKSSNNYQINMDSEKNNQAVDQIQYQLKQAKQNAQQANSDQKFFSKPRSPEIQVPKINPNSRPGDIYSSFVMENREYLQNQQLPASMIREPSEEKSNRMSQKPRQQEEKIDILKQRQSMKKNQSTMSCVGDPLFRSPEKQLSLPTSDQSYRDPYNEFFDLLTQCVKLNSPYIDDILYIDTSEFYSEVRSLGLPFNEWYEWVKSKLHKVIGVE